MQCHKRCKPLRVRWGKGQSGWGSYRAVYSCFVLPIPFSEGVSCHVALLAT